MHSILRLCARARVRVSMDERKKKESHPSGAKEIDKDDFCTFFLFFFFKSTTKLPLLERFAWLERNGGASYRASVWNVFETASCCVLLLFSLRFESKERRKRSPEILLLCRTLQDIWRDGGRRSIGGSKDEMSVKISREIVRREEGDKGGIEDQFLHAINETSASTSTQRRSWFDAVSP